MGTTSKPPERKQALIVEPDQEVAQELQEALNSLGFKVTTLGDTTQVTETLESHQYQLALMNVTLPEMNWIRTFRSVKNWAGNATVITMTRTADEHEIRNAINAGSYVVLDRPINTDQLSCLTSPSNDGMFVLLRG